MARSPKLSRALLSSALLVSVLCTFMPAQSRAGDAINGVWDQLTPAGTLPPGRKYFGAIYDPLRDRLIVVGKFPLDLYTPEKTWSCSFSGPPAWTELTPIHPYARAFNAGIYDPLRDRMLVYGGNDGDPVDSYYPEVRQFLLSTSSWGSSVSVAGTVPPGRNSPTLIYDPVRDRMLVFGGNLKDSGTTQELWQLSLSGTPTWTHLAPAGTPPSSGGAIYDPIRDRMLVFGSGTNQVWQLSLTGTPTWTLLAPTGTPPSARSRPSLIYDPVRDRMVIFAGYDAANINLQKNDVWALSLAGTPAWSELHPLGPVPAPREGHRAVYDALRDRMVIYGGFSAASPEDLWALSWATTTGVDSGERNGLVLRIANPITAAGAVEFSLPNPGTARVAIYDIRGARVRTLVDGPVSAGAQQVRWDRTTDRGERVRTGVFFVHLQSDAGALTRRVLLID